MSLMDNWNKNAFSIYDSEERSVLKIIEKIFESNKEIIEEVLKKTDNTGDHKGSWQGISKPTEVNEGLQTVVDENTEKIQALESEVSKLDDIESTVNKIDFGRHKINYKTVSLTIDKEKDINGIIEQANKINEVANSVVVCPLVNVTSATSSVLEPYNFDTLSTYLDAIENVGLKIEMIKPHIVVNWSDGFNRSNYIPSVITDFFTNWGNVLETYAEVCNERNIPLLCLSCEMDKLTIAEYVENWRSIINSLKNSYPNLKLTCALNSAEIWASIQYYIPQQRLNYLNLLDVIGVNLYPKLTDKIFTPTEPNITIEELNKGWFNSVENDRVVERCFTLYSYYKKPIFVTELGIMAKVDGLKQVIATGETNFLVQSMYYESFFNTVGNSDFLIGFSIWNVQNPFTFEGESLMTLKEYIKGGIL